MRLALIVYSVALIASASMAFAEDARPAAQTAKYSTATTHLTVLLADPEARAIIAKYVPSFFSQPDRLRQAEDMTLKDFQQALKASYDPILSDELRAKMDQDFAQLK